MSFWFRSAYVAFGLTASVCCLFAIVAVSQDEQSYRGEETTGLASGLANGLIISGATAHRIIHFTFDDGPDPRFTPMLLDKLDAVSVKATFFFSASRFRGQDKRNRYAVEIAREALRRGHTIGSHSVDHKRMFRMDQQSVREQLEENDELFQRVFGRRTWLFRPPHGSRSPIVDKMLAERGYTTVLWNIGMADWLSTSAQEVLHTWKRVLERLERETGQRGGVVLLHDTHAWSVDAFDLIYADIMKRNCRLLEQGEELYDVVNDLGFFFAERGQTQPGIFAPAVFLKPAILAARQAHLREDTRYRCVETDSPQTTSDQAFYATKGVSSESSGRM
ncbi:MAG: polysaccharide deacetylase family protein [Deltaproteobacteria bacterium]|nr:polysaccharide deacetylase family protein [Deltaproteobacteria bacterium]